MNVTISELKERLADLDGQLNVLKKEKAEIMNMVFSILKLKNDTFELRRNVAVLSGKFYLVGFVPSNEAEGFNRRFDDIKSVSVVLKPPDTDKLISPPTKLKNGFFARPFSMLVEMYGLPEYNGINPTGFFAITYTILFGLMFGDMGQGAVLFLIGLFLQLKLKNKAGGILTRVGASSMCFGFVYGSVFGFEKLLDPVYKLLGWQGKPLEVFHETNFILLGAIVLGVVLITISIVHNIILGFRQKNYEKALFGANGISGLVFYLSVIIGAAVSMALKIKVFTPSYIIGLIVFPLLLMFFRVPLSSLIKYRKLHVGEEEKVGVGTFIAENFFELFEFLLSYVTNTMSFLRVGGFILSHAGMMLVVMTLAEGVSAGAAPVIIIIGNAFVMAMEGMIVAIQSIRLEFYEIFSRFYEGDGKPFVPVGVCYDTDIE
jgi:V/A-type H+-transporting ATPase subunit I